MSYTIQVTLPIKPIIELEEFATLKKGHNKKTATINSIMLLTSYKTPFVAKIRISATNNKNITFYKIYDFSYIVNEIPESENNNIFNMTLTKIKEAETQTWYTIDEHLVKDIIEV